mmetsp:Transcript_33262/g.37091  ORF Transcript_33262/g.37091 Transcript_33262/m.37091 type:complete len:555 (+) Transcript_33262:80-1744(+)
MIPRNAANHRKADFKKTVSAIEGRRRRTETTVMIRKNKKEQLLKKRRENCSGLELDSKIDDIQFSSNEKPTIADVPRLKAVLLSPNASGQELVEATRGIRRILSVEKNIPAQELVDFLIIPILVRNMSVSSPTSSTTLIFESSWALTNIASTNCTMDLVKAGAIKPLVHLLVHVDAIIREQVAWCLGNIAGEGPDLRDLILQESVIESLVMNLNNPHNMSLLENVVWTISNLCRGTPSPGKSVTAPVIYPLVSFLDKPISEGAKVDILWALSYLSDGDEQNIELVIATGVACKLMRLLEDETTKVRCKIPIVRILGNFVSGNDSQTQVVIESKILDQLAGLLGSQSKTIRKESSWLASNIACGNYEQITQLMNKKQAMKQMILNAKDDFWVVRKEAVWALSHICTSGNDMHAVALVEAGGLEPLVMVLSLQNVDTALLFSTIDALRKILTVGEVHCNESYKQKIAEYNGIEYLEELQTHPSNSVYEKVVSLIEDYFGVANEEDENLAPETNESGMFGFGLASPKQLFPTNFSSDMISQEAFPFGNVSTNTFYPV